jgi:tRNA pseudouridine32 synthase/23S rRNA pseudouridine746 synthase
MHKAADELTVIHADDHLLVVDKPAGLLAVPGRGETKADCLLTRLQTAYPDAQVVHRLDQATSGLMLFARGAAAQRALSIAFAKRQVDKRYVAIVWGEPAEERGTIDLPLAADWPHRPRQRVDAAQGKPSITHWQVDRRLPGGRTRLSLAPVTGRSHQLRVHLAAIGHPILGDALYAPPEAQAAADRLLLHASALALHHPVSRQRLAFERAAGFQEAATY